MRKRRNDSDTLPINRQITGCCFISVISVCLLLSAITVKTSAHISNSVCLRIKKSNNSILRLYSSQQTID